ncbi:type IIL restriction-modification enzyme MmeI [Lacticaseibacillus hegangensis]|uniref:Type IIL restriction-modification enzyme MmeI n=2 Tax=Lacticaseibacillus hegangensis TaxID=2486010 RepID=A0ABW4CTS7_9LACO
MFTYDSINSDPVDHIVPHINQYLLNMPAVIIEPSRTQISGFPEMTKGSSPTDDGNFIVNSEEEKLITEANPEVQKYIFDYYGAKDFLHSTPRRILYLKNAPIAVLQVPLIKSRLARIKDFRAKSSKRTTVALASFPTEFDEDRVNLGPLMAIPRVSSIQREYVPMGYFERNVIMADATFQLANASYSLFALLESKMHTAWLRTVGGKLKSDFRYSNTLVYNTFCFPKLTETQTSFLESYAELILEARSAYLKKDWSLAELYDAVYMPKELRKAHQRNDAFVDSLYGLDNPTHDQRVSRLTELYRARQKM